MRPGDGLLCSHLTGLGLHLITEDVDGNGQDDNRADDDVLNIVLGTGQVQAVADNSHQQSADQGAPDGALAAGEGSAAHDAGCDGVIIIGGTGVAVSGSQTANRHDTSHTGHEAGQGVNEGQHVFGGDTGQTGCLGVAAHAVDLAAQSGLAQEDIKDDEHNDNQNEAEGDTGELHLGGALIIGGEQRAAADPHESVNAGIGEGDGLGAGNDQRQAPQHVLHAHGGHEGMGQIQSGQQRAVDEAGQGADGQAAERQQEGVRDAGLDHNADGAGAQHAVGTNGQVDTGGNQGAQHTGSDQAVDGCLLQDIHEVTDLHELVRHGDAENQNQDGKGHQCTELLQKLFHFRVFHISFFLIVFTS